MGKPVWKAGDTCTIKPSRKHSVLKAKCARLWTVYDVSGDDVLVHDGPAGMTDLRGPGWTCSARVPLDCLLPPVDARPTVAAEAGTEVLRLRARVAELEATLANERGEGEPPVEGWRYDGRCDNGRPGVWECVERELIVTRPLPPAVGWRYARRGGVQVWGQALTARDAMRAASGVPDGN
jgi:hypothetical protein